LETSFKVGEQMLVAEVLAVNVVPYGQLVVVNKGTRFGVHTSQPVFDATGVVGQVVRVTPYSAEVMLITDINHGIPVQVNRNGLRTVAVGSGQIDRLVLPYLSGSADLQPGDLLVTSGLGGGFPQGYPVATVTDMTTHQDSPLAKVSATPTAKLDRLREVLLVWSNSDPIPRVPDQAESPLESASHPDEHGTDTHATLPR
jgi:rod shape-determining protein MreC